MAPRARIVSDLDGQNGRSDEAEGEKVRPCFVLLASSPFRFRVYKGAFKNGYRKTEVDDATSRPSDHCLSGPSARGWTRCGRDELRTRPVGERRPDADVLAGATESRKDGMAAGY